MDRNAFLSALRTRLAAPVPPNLTHPGARLDGLPAVHYLRALDDPISAFAEAAAEVGSVVRSAGAVLLEEVVGATGARTAVVSRDPETEGVAETLERLGVEHLPFDGVESASRADLGVTGAPWVIASTGTVVLHAGRAGGRGASLLPPAHLVLVRERNVLRDASVLFDRARGELPSQMVLATGPSRSADIELTLTIGVHGPGRVWIGILE